MNQKKLKTAESVSLGHPDKIADQISDLVLDLYLKQDPRAKVACETVVKTGLVFLTGEIATKASLPQAHLLQSIRDLIETIGYKGDFAQGFHASSCSIIQALSEQSADIGQTVEKSDELGAGDQGVMVGYACASTKEFLPPAFVYARKCLQVLNEVRKQVDFLGPDAKCQVTVQLNSLNQVERITQVTLSTMHLESKSLKDLQKFLKQEILLKALPKGLWEKADLFLNPSGRFVIGGPESDAGLTGRKIVVDSYGPSVPHGGGAYSGKDPSKVDRTGAYLARWIAKHLVAAEVCSEALVEMAFAIGYPEPVAFQLHLSGLNFHFQAVEQAIQDLFPLKVEAVIKELNLFDPKGFCYLDTAQKGHFGWEAYPWEQLSKIDELKEALKSSRLKS